MQSQRKTLDEAALRAEFIRKLMWSSENPFVKSAPLVGSYTTNSQRIEQFNLAAIGAREHPSMSTTSDFNRKAPSKKPPLASLSSISVSDMDVGKTHRGRVLFCKIVSKVNTLVASAVLVKDDRDDLVEMAVYGLSNARELSEGRNLAIIEPFLKVRADNTIGIHVDDPTDLQFDVEASQVEMTTSTQEGQARLSLEKRLEELVLEDNLIGVQKLHKVLNGEGYRIKKTQVKALKASLLEQRSHGKIEPSTKDSSSPTLIPIISERRPENDRVLYSRAVLEHREKGNQAFKEGKFEEAEQHYSAALTHKDDKKDGVEESGGVHLWQLYGNRSAARAKLGKIDEAMRDSLVSNSCAPADEIKPLLRCAESLSAMGMQKEMQDLLEATAAAYPEQSTNVRNKSELLTPKVILRVGTNENFKTIMSAVYAAPRGAEIIVNPGVYREQILLPKPVTIRCADMTDDYAAIRSLEGADNTTRWVDIHAIDHHAIICHVRGFEPVHIIGCRMSCSGAPSSSWHALLVSSGVVVLRNCVATSSSGPVCATQFASSRLIMQTCAVHGGAQGGILACDQSTMALQQVHCCRHAAGGLEVRTGACVNAEGSHFYANGRQGIFIWHSAGKFLANDCEIHSNLSESGVYVDEGEAILNSCLVYGNGIAGIVAQRKGIVYCFKCEVHDNCEGILIQDTGSASVRQCEVYSNRANGIFVGYDHVGSATIIGNKVYDNQTKGVLIGNLGNAVDVRDNIENKNRGLTPMILKPANLKHFYSPKFAKRVERNRSSIDKARYQRGISDPFDIAMNIQEGEFGLGLKKVVDDCVCCNRSPQRGEPFSKCSRCKIASYCSKECQRSDWSKHKTHCFPPPVKYPTFLDNQESV